MKRGRKKFPKKQAQVRINEAITAGELRLFDESDEMLGVVSLDEASKRASEAETDLIEVNAKTNPPIAKLMDYGKFQYEKKKKEREQKAKAKHTETKTLQVKIGTDEHDLNLKAGRASEWLNEGHRIKLDLFLPGRSKYLDRQFLEGRLERLLELVTVDYKIASEPKKSPKGLTVVLEKAKRKKENADKASRQSPEANTEKSSTEG